MRLTDARVSAIKPPASGQEEHADDLVTGLRLRVGAGGRKSWIVRTRAGGKVLNKTLGSYPVMRLADARDAARAMLLDLSRNGGVERPTRTFEELAEHWVRSHAKERNATWRLQERRLQMHVLPAWKDRPVDKITRADVRALVEGIEGEVLPNRVLAIVRTLFRHARRRDWIEHSPAEGIERPKAEASRDRVLTMEEIRRVYAAADLLGYPVGGFIKTLILTAQRRTEAAAMRWADLDLEAATWTLPADTTKSARAHLVPLSAPLVDQLKATPKLGPYVWTTDGESYVSGFAKAKGRLDTYLKATGAELAPWTFHDLRRTVATHMVRLGVLEAVVGRLLNHAPQGVTAQVYALHSYAPEKRAALEAWALELHNG